MQSRTRECNNSAPANSGKDCQGPAKKTRKCNDNIPCPIPGGWTNWSPFGVCSRTCGVVLQIRTRTCTNPPPQFGGADCEGPSKDTRKCKIKACPVDGQWGPWSAYNTCSKTCRIGIQTRKRKCNNPAPAYGGKDCVGPSTYSRKCNVYEWCPIDGAWSSWGQYGACSKPCGYGVQSRYRTCNNPPPAYKGKKCPGEATSTKSCRLKSCYSVASKRR